MEKSITDQPTGPTAERYHNNIEQEGRPTLVSVDEDDVTVNPSEINDDSTGIGKDDFFGKNNKE